MRGAGILATALATVLGLGGCGGGPGGAEDRDGPGPVASSDPFREVRRDAERPAALRSAPRWEQVARHAGTGRATRTAQISRAAIQWRARWRCERGRLALTTGEGEALAGGGCPGRGVSTAAAATGLQRLGVRADGPWSVEVEQQVDTALREPPLRAMRSAGARVLATGRFYGVERRGGGRVALHRLAGGRLALRFDDLATSPNTDLYVWVAPLASTLGDQNYLLPAGLRAQDVRSVVIWCEPVRIAYAAASLRAR
jgi:hypothetical protein